MRVEDRLQKIMRRFDASDEHTKELRSEPTPTGHSSEQYCPKSKKKMDIVWNSQLKVVRKPFTH